MVTGWYGHRRAAGIGATLWPASGSSRSASQRERNDAAPLADPGAAGKVLDICQDPRFAALPPARG